MRKVAGGRSAIVVGNGPTAGILAWQHARREIQKQTGKLPDVVLLNDSAMGKHVPDYAVAVSPQVLERFQERGLHSKTVVVTNHPQKSIGGKRGDRDDLSQCVELLSAEKTLFGPLAWPRFAAGPLAVWTLSALGYESIYLFAFDGSAHTDSDAAVVRRATVWEAWIARYREARRGRVGPDPRLVRIWPDRCKWSRNDPLKNFVDRTLFLKPQKKRRKKGDGDSKDEPASTSPDGSDGGTPENGSSDTGAGSVAQTGVGDDGNRATTTSDAAGAKASA